MELVDLGVLDLNTAVAKVTSSPANILGIDSGVIRKGSPADLCILKKDKWTFNNSKRISSGMNNPFTGKNFNICVDKTICNGKIVYESK